MQIFDDLRLKLKTISMLNILSKNVADDLLFSLYVHTEIRDPYYPNSLAFLIVLDRCNSEKDSQYGNLRLQPTDVSERRPGQRRQTERCLEAIHWRNYSNQTLRKLGD